ncbi:hypothetical protein L9W92_17940 [Pelotomaculum terephthalicicum JT]|uniref:hypothetical protein n=1 Tax=Pelotomaculum TaxID=191373 RepID=UPI0009D236A2|nr:MULTISPECIES: hypothetical protein [Pelotomaculum]MCG9969881.1 hypothetical protein [Pelotomaculum terephthalicicum JT]OPX87258.1 MAG: hypothetical protein A4E54_01754 [Pelotomaculum sp. PtaB.Bin117]OPY60371.1 MAG: hypothetical protein A4E56_02737 [Pelotomaculum sp. PtaU1.Bin065]
MNYAASAANIDGNLEDVALNETKAKRYFEDTFDEMMESRIYTINSFQTVDTGDSVPHDITAKASGYVANITVEIPAVNVPLIGQQSVNVPMAYYAIVQSVQLD